MCPRQVDSARVRFSVDVPQGSFPLLELGATQSKSNYTAAQLVQSSWARGVTPQANDQVQQIDLFRDSASTWDM